MTPFMLRVQTVAAGAAPPAAPALVATLPRSVATGTDRHMAVRALAEQLVAEANAVLGSGALDLTDRPGLAFTVRHRGRSAEIATTVAGHAATARLDGNDVELADEHAVAELLLRLLAG
jgi:hypothetical protein